ncbi:TetR/AcrR family transcriptional regulator [Streptomyces fulvoviolaceus]|uniref:TetR/AcrR family transcriptional regulator n=1 Tax=Streptomyces fulvoviolaceus TaxID=285535 RepID=UPI0004C490CF|nr:TetR/AcrR family transcriptional regulator [Streptomyces fulvoviolaceus]
MGAEGTPTRRRRVDATHNRERIVSAALDVMLEHGADAPIDKIARRAEVGNATVYRHFPDRDELIRGITVAVTEETARFAEEALAEHSDPAQALRRFLHRAVDGRIVAVSAAFGGWIDKVDPAFAAASDRLLASVRRIVAQGQQEGLVRSDVTDADVLMALWQLARPLPGIEDRYTHNYTHRNLDLLVDGLCTPAPARLSGVAVTFDDMHSEAAG